MNSFRSLAFALAVLCAQAGAQPGTFVQYETQPGVVTEAPDPAAGVSFTAPSAIPRVLNGTVTVFGQADYLTAKAGVSGSGPSFYASAYSGWTDLLTFASPGLTGQAGFVDMTFNYRWDVGVTGTPGPTASAIFVFTFSAMVPGPVDFGRTVSESVNAYEGVNYRFGPTLADYQTGQSLGDVSGSSITFHIPMVFGQEYWVAQGISTSVYGLDNAADTVAYADAAHSLTWGGVTASDAFGNAVVFGVASASGVDYLTMPGPVPEPETFLLLAIGLAMLRWKIRSTSRPFLRAERITT